jgi:hypothetical protein
LPISAKEDAARFTCESTTLAVTIPSKGARSPMPRASPSSDSWIPPHRPGRRYASGSVHSSLRPRWLVCGRRTLGRVPVCGRMRLVHFHPKGDPDPVLSDVAATDGSARSRSVGLWGWTRVRRRSAPLRQCRQPGRFGVKTARNRTKDLGASSYLLTRHTRAGVRSHRTDIRYRALQRGSLASANDQICRPDEGTRAEGGEGREGKRRSSQMVAKMLAGAKATLAGLLACGSSEAATAGRPLRLPSGR